MDQTCNDSFVIQAINPKLKTSEVDENSHENTKKLSKTKKMKLKWLNRSTTTRPLPLCGTADESLG